MARLENLTRRDALKLGAGGAAMFALSASGLAIPRGFAGGGGGGGGRLYLEAFPTSPLITRPFYDELPIRQALRPTTPSVVGTWASPPSQDCQDSLPVSSDNTYKN